MSRLKQYLSMEDIIDNADVVEDDVEIEVPEVQPTTAEDVLEADAAIQEVVEAQNVQVSEINEAEHVKETLSQELGALESYREILQHGIETEQFSPQFAALVHTSLERFNDMFDVSNDKVSLENHSHDTLGEYYTVSLEAVDGFINKLKNATSGVKAKIERTRTHIGKEKTARDAMVVKADAALNALASVTGTEKVAVSTSGVAGRLSTKGGFPQNIAQAAAADLKARQYMVGTVLKAQIGYASKLLAAAEKVATSGSSEDGKTDDHQAAADAIKHPLASVEAGVADGSKLFGNGVVQDSNGNYSYETVKASGGDKSVSLGKADVAAMAKVVKQYAVFLGGEADKTSELYKKLDDVEKVFKKLKVPAGDFKKLIDRAVSALDSANEIEMDTYLSGSRSAFALAQLVERAAGQLAKGGKSEE